MSGLQEGDQAEGQGVQSVVWCCVVDVTDEHKRTRQASKERYRMVPRHSLSVLASCLYC